MPRELKGIKEWLERAKQNDARSVTIKRNPHDIKFKVRCSRFLYTLVLKNVDTLKADRLKLSLPPNLQVKEVKCRKSKIPSQ